MQEALKDKTNRNKNYPMKNKTKILSEKDRVVMFIEEVSNMTKDMALKYDLFKCREILEGKENQDVKDLKETIEEILLEKEVLFHEKCELEAELNRIRCEGRKKKHDSSGLIENNETNIQKKINSEI